MVPSNTCYARLSIIRAYRFDNIMSMSKSCLFISFFSTRQLVLRASDSTSASFERIWQVSMEANVGEFLLQYRTINCKQHIGKQAVLNQYFVYMITIIKFGLSLVCHAMAIIVMPKIHPSANSFTEKTCKNAKYFLSLRYKKDR